MTHYIIKTDNVYSIVGARGFIPKNKVCLCVKDPLGNVITNIKYYTMSDDKILNIDYKGWLTKDVV